ncbi:unnamed protein product, partial [Amoebophrya sp. A120]|eukprot:GSA120T00000320001.1
MNVVTMRAGAAIPRNFPGSLGRPPLSRRASSVCCSIASNGVVAGVTSTSSSSSSSTSSSSYSTCRVAPVSCPSCCTTTSPSHLVVHRSCRAVSSLAQQPGCEHEGDALSALDTPVATSGLLRNSGGSSSGSTGHHVAAHAGQEARGSSGGRSRVSNDEGRDHGRAMFTYEKASSSSSRINPPPLQQHDQPYVEESSSTPADARTSNVRGPKHGYDRYLRSGQGRTIAVAEDEDPYLLRRNRNKDSHGGLWNSKGKKRTEDEEVVDPEQLQRYEEDFATGESYGIGTTSSSSTSTSCGGDFSSRASASTTEEIIRNRDLSMSMHRRAAVDQSDERTEDGQCQGAADLTATSGSSTTSFSSHPFATASFASQQPLTTPKRCLGC